MWIIRGLLVDVALIVSAILYILIGSMVIYSGTCGPILLTPAHPCPLGAYLAQNFLLALVVALVMWPIVIGILLLPPLAFFAYEQRESKWIIRGLLVDMALVLSSLVYMIIVEDLGSALFVAGLVWPIIFGILLLPPVAFFAHERIKRRKS